MAAEEYTTRQVKVPSNPLGNANIADGWAALWAHHQGKVVYDGTYYYIIQVTLETNATTPHNFRIYRIDPRQETPIVSPINYKLGNVYQGPSMVIDNSNRLHVFFVETDTTDAVAGTERVIRHYRSNNAALSLTNSSIFDGEWTLIESFYFPNLPHCYINAAYSNQFDTLYLVYNDENADLQIRRNSNQNGWGDAHEVQAASSSHIGGQLYRALYAHIVPLGPDKVDLLWMRAFNQSNYDQIIYKRITRMDDDEAEANIILLDKSPGSDGDPLLLANTNIILGVDAYIHVLYWNSDNNEHFHIKRLGNNDFGDPVSITASDPNNREYRQYGVFLEQRNPMRLHVLLSPALTEPPDNGLAFFWSDTNGDSWHWERDFYPPLASTTTHDYPDYVTTYTTKIGEKDNRNTFIVVYDGINTVVNTLSNNALRVVLEILSYEVNDSNYVKNVDPQEIIKDLLNSYWRPHFENVPKPTILDVDDPEIERIDARDDDYIMLQANADYSEQQLGYLFLFKTIRIPIEIIINTKHSRTRLLDLKDEIQRIIYLNQINFPEIGNFHKLEYQHFSQEYDREKKYWTGTITVELQADGITVVPPSVLRNVGD